MAASNQPGPAQPTTPGTLPTGIVQDPLYREHRTGRFHPERPERFDALVEAIWKSDFAGRLVQIPARDASREELLACHTLGYLALAREEIEGGVDYLSTGDAPVSERTWEVALRAAGGVLAAVDAVMGRKIANAFCAVRPPGHHATPDRGMGFCILNNIAIAARYAQRAHGIGRVLIVDWDVHHGNGTQEIFYEDDSVFFFSTHQSPLYPGTGMEDEKGAGRGEGYTLNCPFPSGAGRAEILGAFIDHLVPAMEEFRPEFIFISAGFDSRVRDPLGNFRLTDEDFADLTRLITDMAARYGHGRVVSVLEGGYELDGLCKAALAHVRCLTEAASPQ